MRSQGDNVPCKRSQGVESRAVFSRAKRDRACLQIVERWSMAYPVENMFRNILQQEAHHGPRGSRRAGDASVQGVD
jgi:hypothetical protein